MKVLCKKELLLKALNTVSKAVSQRTTMEILKCIVLKTSENELVLTANDQILGIEKRIEAEVENEGVIAINASLIINLINTLPESNVCFETSSQNTVKITCENKKSVIPYLNADDFIQLPKVDENNFIKVSQFTVREMINKVNFATSASDINSAMNGINIEVNKNKLRMTALDGHRVAIRNSELKEEYSKFSAIVPANSLNNISKITTGDSDEIMTICFSKNHIMFEFEKTKVISRVIDGEYFKIDSLLKEVGKTKFDINRKEFLECLNYFMNFTSESDKKPVIMKIKDNELSLNLKSNRGQAEDHLLIHKDGKDLKIAFNPKLLIDALRVIEDENVTLSMVEFNTPCIIKDEEENYTYIVLPVNFTED